MGIFQDIAICRRVAKLRCGKCGPRGKASFAKMLGISPSTYDYYESARVPPAELLLKIADVGGVDLRWLLTGELTAGHAVAANHPAVRRAAELIGDHPQAAEPLLAFLDVLEKTLAFPQKNPEKLPAKASGESAAETATMATALPKTGPSEKTAPSEKTGPLLAPLVSSAPPDSPAAAGRGWIPILGRSAAGVPKFWAQDEDATGLTTLGDLIARCTESPSAGDIEPGQALAGGTCYPDPAARAAAQPVQIITLRTPIAWGKAGQGGKRPRAGRCESADGPVVSQFIAAAAIKARFPDAFAVRIDGDSMSPEIYHGDLVVLSASAPAVAGQPAVVQIENAVGVTCKLYHPRGECLNLDPINPDGQTVMVALRQVEWALRVLARIRPQGGN